MSILHFYKENFVANHASLFDLESYKISEMHLYRQERMHLTCVNTPYFNGYLRVNP